MVPGISSSSSSIARSLAILGIIMDRRFFVLTTTGERGPFTIEDLKRECQSGLVSRADQLRTALGKSAGTVGENIGPGGPGRLSNRMPVAISATAARQSTATKPRPIAENRRSPSGGGGRNSNGSGRICLRANRDPARGNVPRLVPVFLGLGFLALVAGAWWLTRATL